MSLVMNNVTGGYSAVPVIENINFSVAPGELVGLIGLNGAGKSTTIKHIIGLLLPFSGEIEIDGKTLQQDPEGYRKSFAYVPETPVLYEELTLREHLEVTALAYGIPKEQAMERATVYLREFRLEDKLDWFPAYFSKGMKQKVMLVCAFLIETSLYVIDEPFLGLDPLGIHSFLDIIREKKARGAGILMSTHVLASAERECDRFVLLHEGKVKVQGTMGDLQRELGMPGATLDELYLRLTREQEAAGQRPEMGPLS